MDTLTFGGGAKRGQFLVSCEHASNRIPARYGRLGLSPGHLKAHIAWDPGAKEIARACARVLACPCHEGQYSRLLVDLNRSPHHPRVIAKESASIRVPGNVGLSKAEREQRIKLYYIPYRQAVVADIRKLIARQGRCIHLSVHSFTHRLLGMERKGDIGLLFDPRRQQEKALCVWIAERLRKMGYHVRFNYPYRGINDGFTTANRRVFSPREYWGIEIEVNQKLLRGPATIRRMAETFAEIWRAAISEA